MVFLSVWAVFLRDKAYQIFAIVSDRIQLSRSCPPSPCFLSCTGLFVEMSTLRPGSNEMHERGNVVSKYKNHATGNGTSLARLQVAPVTVSSTNLFHHAIYKKKTG